MANRLANETSPYLLQHAHNPVDWYPWGEEALTKAREEDKPILLSVGYSACHWCHVMERESFDDEATAALMNDGFVNIKVDREERPDIDAIYMRAVQASFGRGGWPLTAFLTPDGRFFYGGTYFPPTPRHGMPSFRQVLEATLDAYRNRRHEVEKGSDQLLAVLRGTPSPEAGAESAGTDDPEVILAAAGPDVTDHAARYFAGQFHPPHGGFGPAPKFPQPVTLEFLLRYYHRTGREELLSMVLTTLRAMARGGMRDHLAGGFHRYSVDDRWLVPHFEKMLYDNGLLARVYLHAWQITGESELREVCESTLDYLLEDLRHPEGGFYSARDADSEGEEGTFYIWSPEEVEAVLGPERAERFCRIYDVSEGGNFEGKSIINLSGSLDSWARDEGLDPEDLARKLATDRAELKAARAAREHPFRDEKVLLSWNSFVVRALAEAGASLDRPEYLEAAIQTAEFLVDNMRTDGRCFRSWKDGQARVFGFLEDYAGLGNALLTLYEVTLDPRWLTEAKGLGSRIVAGFWEEDEGLFYDAPVDADPLVVRPREVMDNATPAGNSMAAELLLRLHDLYDIPEFRAIGVRTLLREGDALRRFPSAFGRLLSVMTRALTPPVEVVIVGDPAAAGEFLRSAHRDYLPTRVVAGGNPSALPFLPLLTGREWDGGGPRAYVCRDMACTPAISDIDGLGEELRTLARTP